MDPQKMVVWNMVNLGFQPFGASFAFCLIQCIENRLSDLARPKIPPKWWWFRYGKSLAISGKSS